jgi:hypothetical protein
MSRKYSPLLLASIAICLSGFAREHKIPLLPDLSGLAWIEGDRFLAVHDAKNPGETGRPRASIIKLPDSPEDIECKSLSVEWPAPLGPSSDLESIARIPQTESFLLVESGERFKGVPPYRRVFRAEIDDDKLKIREFAELPSTIINIEGTAVARAGNRLVFIYAERADGEPGTDIIWSELEISPLRLRASNRVRFRPPSFTGPNWRPVSAIEIDSLGRVYVASAMDADDDNGPFRSCIWRIGQVRQSGRGATRVSLYARPVLIARMDGLKIESLAFRERQGRIELFAGTDDENYGGALRPVRIRQ